MRWQTDHGFDARVYRDHDPHRRRKIERRDASPDVISHSLWSREGVHERELADRRHHHDRRLHPLRAVSNCIRARQAADPSGTTGIYNAMPTLNSHSYFYYWRDLGWQSADDWRVDEMQRRLVDVGRNRSALPRGRLRQRQMCRLFR